MRLGRPSTSISARKLRKELTFELSKLRGLEVSVDGTFDEAAAEALASRICQQAEVCLDLLDQYEASVPGPGWSYAERSCHPLREELKRTGTFFRAASGEMERRAGTDAYSAKGSVPSPQGGPARHAARRQRGPVNQSLEVSEATYYRPQHPYPSDVYLWLENDLQIMLRAMNGKYPVELRSRDARDLGRALIELADRSDKMRRGGD